MRYTSKDTFQVVVDHVVFEERSARFEEVPVTPMTREKLFVCNKLTGIAIHVKETLTPMISETITNTNGTYNRISALLERLVLQAVEKVLKTPTILEKLTKDELENPELAALVAALVKPEYKRLIMEQDKIEKRCRQFVEIGAKSSHSAPTMISEQGEELPVDILNEL